MSPESQLSTADRRRKKRRSARAAVSLPDDVLVEILFSIRNDRAALFRCATACKPWRRLVADPAFLQRCWPPGTNASCSFAGFFTKKRHHLQRGAGLPPVWAPCFFPAPRSALSPALRALGSFFPAAPADINDHAVPISSRHGLLLARLKDAYPNRTTLRLVVCDLLSGAYELLPPLTRCSYTLHQGFTTYAILTGADCHLVGGRQQQPMPHFKVLVIDVMHNIDVYMFSSGEAGTWSCASSKRLDAMIKKVHLYQTDVVSRAGTVHWLFYNPAVSLPPPRLCTLDVNAETGHVSTRNIRMDARPYFDEPCITLAVDNGGELSLLWLKMERLEVEIWTQEDDRQSVSDDDNTSRWHCTRVVVLKEPNKLDIWGERELHILGEKCGSILVMDGRRRVYIAHLETGVMEEVMGWPGCYLNHGEPVPVEINWPALFLSRLGSQ